MKSSDIYVFVAFAVVTLLDRKDLDGGDKVDCSSSDWPKWAIVVYSMQQLQGIGADGLI